MSISGPPDSPPNQRYQAALEYLYNRINYERIVEPSGRYKFRLQRITELMLRLGLSEYLYQETNSSSANRPKFPLIHIAGTKGKGSTAAMVAAVLTESGLRTGLYSSPHLHKLEERFRIDSVPCSENELVRLVGRVTQAAEEIEPESGPASFFELTTALAMLHFATAGCDAIVLEVGLGGRLDSTNVFAPSVTAVTSIGFDHQHVLGNTLAEIAAEKAGIIKTNVPVVSGVTDDHAANVVADFATKHQSDLFQLGTDFEFKSSPTDDWGSEFAYHGLRKPLRDRIAATLQMEGDHQCRNAAVAIAILDLLQHQGISIPTVAIERGLNQLTCIGRIERFRLPTDVIGIVDAAHNRDSIDALCDTLSRRYIGRPITVVFGTSIDKEAKPILEALSRIADKFVLTRFWGNPRFRPTSELLESLPESMKSNTTVVDDPVLACQRGLQSVTPGGTLVACGSFFLAAETREWFDAK